MAETIHPFGDPQAAHEVVFTGKQGSQPDNTRGTECFIPLPEAPFKSLAKTGATDHDPLLRRFRR